MEDLLASGLLKDRLRAARLGAAVARANGAVGRAPLSAAIFSAFLPGQGTTAGTVFGQLLTTPIPAQT